MQPLPLDFLKEMARLYQLSEEQEEAFIAVLSDNKNLKQIADELHISDNALRTRLTGVYRKFSFNQRGPNKRRLLHDLLQKKCQKDQPGVIEKKEEDINATVKKVREQIRPLIKQLCGTIKVLDMTQDMDLDDIYTDVNILEKITTKQRFGLVELQQACQLEAENFERLGFGKVKEERVAGLEAVKRHSKLMVWGKPGAGKTTFLKYLAMQCLIGELQAELVPLFITLKEFAEKERQPNLLTYIIQQFDNSPETSLQEVINSSHNQTSQYWS
ncbi:MAG: NACHT domain-containing protein [Spirulinaceae cyanobacterium]